MHIVQDVCRLSKQFGMIHYPNMRDYSDKVLIQIAPTENQLLKNMAIKLGLPCFNNWLQFEKEIKQPR